MKIVCGTKELLGAVTLVSRACPTRTTMPIYQSIKIVVDDNGGVVLMGTDLELGIRYRMNGETQVKKNGMAIVPPSQLMAILRETDDDTVTIETDAKGVYVTTSMGEFDMPTDNPDGFESVEGFLDEQDCVELPATLFKTMVKRTVFASAKDEGKYAMQGILFDTDGVFKLVATDGKRLAVANGPKVDVSKEAAIVPSKAVALASQVLADDDDDAVVKVTWDKSRVWFQTPKATIASRLVEGRFPSWRDVIPKKATVTLDLDTQPFFSAVRQAAIMADDESKRVEMNFENNKVLMAARGATTGKSSVTLNLVYDNDPLSIAFDPQFLNDAFKAMGSKITMSIVDGKRPAVFKDGDDYLHMIVPMV